jgi:uncharacterized protein YdeI (BOF family)
MVTNIGDLQVRDDFIVTIAGTVIGVREDEFLLQDGTGQVWVDAVRRGAGTIDLPIGERVTVTGDFDDLEDFDATRIVRADGTEVIGQPSGNGRPGNGNGRPGSGNGRPGNGNGNSNGAPGNNQPINISDAPRVDIGDLQVRDNFTVTITGTVTRVDEDEFVLRDQTGQVLVDGIQRGSGNLDIAVGDRLTVVGDLDDEDFDALRITRPDGSTVASQPARSPDRRRDDDFRDERDDDFGGPPPWAGRPGGPRSFLQSTDIISAQEFSVNTSAL